MRYWFQSARAGASGWVLYFWAGHENGDNEYDVIGKVYLDDGDRRWHIKLPNWKEDDYSWVTLPNLSFPWRQAAENWIKWFYFKRHN